MPSCIEIRGGVLTGQVPEVSPTPLLVRGRRILQLSCLGQTGAIIEGQKGRTSSARSTRYLPSFNCLLTYFSKRQVKIVPLLAANHNTAKDISPITRMIPRNTKHRLGAFCSHPTFLYGRSSATYPAARMMSSAPIQDSHKRQESAVLHRSIKAPPRQVVTANGRRLTFSNGQEILDSTCGAAVSCIGNNNERVKKAMLAQMDKFSYCNSMFFGHPIGEELCAELIDGTQGAMAKAYVMCSGQSLLGGAAHALF